MLPARIIIAERDRGAQESFRSALAKLGAELITVESEKALLDEVRSFPPHLIVLDVGLGGFDTLETVIALAPAARILLASEFDLAACPDDCRVWIADACVLKPCSSQEIERHARRLLRSRESSSPAHDGRASDRKNEPVREPNLERRGGDEAQRRPPSCDTDLRRARERRDEGPGRL